MLTVSNIAWDDGSDPAFLESVADAGFDGIDIAPTKIWPGWQLPDDCGASFRGQLDQYGLCAIGMQSLFFGAGTLNLFSQVDDDWQAFFSHMGKLAEIATATGATRIVFGAPASRDPHGLDADTAWQIACERLRLVGDLYQNRSIALCMEPVPSAIGGRFLCSTMETADFLRAVNHSSVKLNLDTAVLLHENADILETITQCADIVGHVHASEPALGNFEHPRVDHAAVSAALRKVGYNGAIAIEMAAAPGVEESNLVRALDYVKAIYG